MVIICTTAAYWHSCAWGVSCQLSLYILCIQRTITRGLMNLTEWTIGVDWISWRGGLNQVITPIMHTHALTRTPIRLYVRIRWTAISQKCMDQIFETLRQGQVWSEDYARQLDFWHHSKWRPSGHLGCKHTWSHNSNTTNWISFKLGAERKLRTNMYAHLFSVRFKKWRPYLFFDPQDISKSIQDIVLHLSLSHPISSTLVPTTK